MTPATRRRILRANAAFLILVGTVSFVLDLRAAFFGVGPASGLIREAPHAAIGFVEAHGLAAILGILFALAAPSRGWHLTAAGVHVLLAVCNLVFWQAFVAGGMLAVGYGTTALHGLFVVLELAAAASAPRSSTLRLEAQ